MANKKCTGRKYPTFLPIKVLCCSDETHVLFGSPESIFSPNTAWLPQIRLLEKRFSLQDSVLYHSLEKDRSGKMKQAKDYIQKGFTKRFFSNMVALHNTIKWIPHPLLLHQPSWQRFLWAISAEDKIQKDMEIKYVSQHRRRHTGSAAPTATKLILWLKRKSPVFNQYPSTYFNWALKQIRRQYPVCICPHSRIALALSDKHKNAKV